MATLTNDEKSILEVYRTIFTVFYSTGGKLPN